MAAKLTDSGSLLGELSQLGRVDLQLLLRLRLDGASVDKPSILSRRLYPRSPQLATALTSEPSPSADEVRELNLECE